MTAAIPHYFGDTSAPDPYPPEFWEQTEEILELVSDFHPDLVEAVVVGLKDLAEKRDDEGLDRCVDELLCDQESR
jgi:N-acetyl-anhydromuramyl-L-alanine amidase AmpD